MFAQHFSCGSSVTGDDEIVIQGDVCSDVIDFIQQKWPEVQVHSMAHGYRFHRVVVLYTVM